MKREKQSNNMESAQFNFINQAPFILSNIPSPPLPPVPPNTPTSHSSDDFDVVLFGDNDDGPLTKNTPTMQVSQKSTEYNVITGVLIGAVKEMKQFWEQMAGRVREGIIQMEEGIPGHEEGSDTGSDGKKADWIRIWLRIVSEVI